MKIKIIKKIEIIGYEITKEVEVYVKSIKEWSEKEVMSVCVGENEDEDGMGWEVKNVGDGVMIVSHFDGDVEFVVVKLN
jgi:hypothetical protein